MNPDALVSAVAGQLRARTTSTPSTDWRAPMPADPCPTCDEARARADALQARLDAFAGPVEGVDVEAVLEDFDIYQRLDAEGNHPPNRIRMEAILGRLGRQAPALAREVVALRDALATAEQERDELRLPLAADKATG